MVSTFFTYGTAKQFPFINGYTEIVASTTEECIKIFRALHPDKTPGIVNCAFIYKEKEFNEIPDKFKGKCHERYELLV